MVSVNVADYASWRQNARALLWAGTPPGDVLWVAQSSQTALPFGGETVPAAADGAKGPPVPRRFHALAETAACHRDPARWAALYRLLHLKNIGDRIFTHTAEGDDDMPAHVRNVLTQTSIGVPIEDGKLALGTWQGLYLWEHRTSPHRRRVTVTVIGE